MKKENFSVKNNSINAKNEHLKKIRIFQREGVLDLLQKSKIFEKKDGIWVVDLERLGFIGFDKIFKTKVGLFRLNKGMFLSLLSGFKCLSKKDYDNGIREERRFLNLPDTIESFISSLKELQNKKNENLNIDSDFLPDGYINYKYFLNQGEVDKIELSNGDYLNGFEIELAEVIFSKLKGFRDKDGVLKVIDPSDKILKNFNFGLILKNYPSFVFFIFLA